MSSTDYTIKRTDPNNIQPIVIKAYTTNGPASPTSTTPLHQNAVSANTSLVLLGKGMFDYGEPIQSDLVHMLENFACPTPPAYPIPGQLWYQNYTYDTVDNPELISSPFYNLNNPVTRYELPTYDNLQSITNILPSFSCNTHLVQESTGRVFKWDCSLGVGNYRWTERIDTKRLSVYTGPNPTTDWLPLLNDGGIDFDLDMGGYKIINVGDPTNPTDVMTLSYADSTYVDATGDTMTGNLIMDTSTHIVLTSEATASNHAVSKGYVDALVTGNIGSLDDYYISKSGATDITGDFVYDGTSIPGSITLNSYDLAISNGDLSVHTGNVTFNTATINLISTSIVGNVDISGNLSVTGTNTITLGNNRIQQVADPINNQDAATKAYVDSQILSVGYDGTLDNAVYNPSTGTLTLNSTIGLPVQVSGFLTPDDIIPSTGTGSNTYNALDTPADNSWLACKLRETTSNFPNNTIQQAIGQLDVGLSTIFNASKRHINTISQHSIINKGIAIPTVPITNVILGSNTWEVAGDYTSQFLIGSSIRVHGNSGDGNGVHVITNTSFDGTYTQIVVLDPIDPLATGDGDIIEIGGVWVISGDIAPLLATDAKIEVMNNTGGGDGYYRVIRYNTYAGNTYIVVTTDNPITAPYTTDGDMVVLTIVLPFEYTVELNSLLCTINGVKQYNGVRGRSIVSFPNETQSTDIIPFVLDTPYDFQVVVDGGITQTITITLSTLYSYAIFSLPSNKSITVQGNATTSLMINQTFLFEGTVGTTTELLDGTYTVAGIEYDNDNNTTTITTVETMPEVEFDPGELPSGFIKPIPIYTYIHLLVDINAEMTGAYAVFYNHSIVFISNTTGPSSTVVITDGNMFSTLLDSITNGDPGVEYAYKEIGRACRTSNIIEFVTNPGVGNVIEVIDTK